MSANVSTDRASRDRILEHFHRYQERHEDTHYIPSVELREIARTLDVSVADVYGVLSFYHLFSDRPRGRYVLRLCDSLSCRICGSVDLYTYLVEKLGLRRNNTTDDGLFSLEIVNCLGSCDTAPNIMINDRLVTNLTPEKLDALLEEVQR